MLITLKLWGKTVPIVLERDRICPLATPDTVRMHIKPLFVINRDGRLLELRRPGDD